MRSLEMPARYQDRHYRTFYRDRTNELDKFGVPFGYETPGARGNSSNLAISIVTALLFAARVGRE